MTTKQALVIKAMKKQFASFMRDFLRGPGKNISSSDKTQLKTDLKAVVDAMSAS